MLFMFSLFCSVNLLDFSSNILLVLKLLDLSWFFYFVFLFPLRSIDSQNQPPF
jgi:hypothetical protein